MNNPKEHEHPNNPRNKIFGVRLNEGDTIKEGDFYTSCDGIWREDSQHVNRRIFRESLPSSTFWVRPVQKSETEKRD